tara:strand:- start:471 stop:659 length:189 start_codon:yes stop_codon:yes gene_type:complete
VLKMKDRSGYIDCPKCSDYEGFLAVDPKLGHKEGGKCHTCGYTVNTPLWLSQTGTIFGRDYT